MIAEMRNRRRGQRRKEFAAKFRREVVMLLSREEFLRKFVLYAIRHSQVGA
jgi:hypothetical protein